MMGDRWFHYKAIVSDKDGKLFRFVFMENNISGAQYHADMISRNYGYFVNTVSRLDSETGKKLIAEDGIFIAI